ncbi:MAG: HD domain-containing protein [Lactobacillaceae bacterium]|jgi:HD superfamily phosphohydrolase|nr:HD domain-containing protein [Lactobacillaceae bacterium]
MANSKYILAKERVLRDPILNFIRVEDQTILDLINSSEVQRLRRVKALGVANLVFHGGEHSRFQHSLGVYEITRRMITHFDVNRPTFWNHDEDIVVMAAGLLHDVGHGAYSHTFEHIFGTNHEQFTQDIILNPDTQVNQILSARDKDLPAKVASVIAKTYENRLVISMISSQIDADRMDYLLRDAYYTGAEYGKFDIERIMEMMIPTDDGIIFNEAGVHTVEDYIISRYQMYIQVYFHPVSRGMEVVLENLLSRAQAMYNEKLEPELFFSTIAKVFEVGKNISTEDYLKLDDGVFTTAFSIWRDSKDPVLSDLSRRFLDRIPFKSIPYSESKLRSLEAEVEAGGFDKFYYSGTNNANNIPYKSYSNRNKKNKPIQFAIGGDLENQKGLSSLSTIVKALDDDEITDNRFFFPKELLETDDNLKKIYATSRRSI